MSKTPDKCPKCGAKQWSDSGDLRTYMCGSQVKNGEMVRETDTCSLTRLAQLFEMREKLYKEKLAEAIACITSEHERAELAEKELGKPTDEPNPNGSIHARLNWWKDQCDKSI